MITSVMDSAAASHLLDLDPLSCQEETRWFESDTPPPVDGGVEEEEEGGGSFLWEEQEEEEEVLQWLLSKEGESDRPDVASETDPSLSGARKEGASWLVRASASLGFAAQTTLLAVDYFDRFVSSGPWSQPWMTQLASVACLSLAAKVEETHVPLLLDLQVEETRFVFEPRTVQRMELLLLSALGWKMNPVTPLSFIDHTVRRIGAEISKDWAFQRRCHSILLSLVTDPRWSLYLPSVLACATMLQALVGSPLLQHQNQILDLLKPNKEEVKCCHQFIIESSGASAGSTTDNGVAGGGGQQFFACNKRKFSFCSSSPPSPNCIFVSQFSFDSSNDSWAAAPTTLSSSSLLPEHPLLKRPSNGSVGPED